MKNITKILPVIIFVFVVCAGLYHLSIYELGDDDQVVVTQFGKVVGAAKSIPGEYFKLPLIQKAHYFTKNTHVYKISHVVQTLDKKFLRINSTIQWKIVDAVKYMENLNSYKLSNSTIDDAVSNAQLMIIIDNTLNELIGGKATLSEFSDLEINNLITSKIEDLASTSIPDYGLELITMNIFITYPANFRVLTTQ